MATVPGSRWLKWALAGSALLAAGCATVITRVKDCDKVDGVKRVECGACVLPNEAEGWLGTYEYRPDASEGKRCSKAK